MVDAFENSKVVYKYMTLPNMLAMTNPYSMKKKIEALNKFASYLKGNDVSFNLYRDTMISVSDERWNDELLNDKTKNYTILCSYFLETYRELHKKKKKRLNLTHSLAYMDEMNRFMGKERWLNLHTIVRYQLINLVIRLRNIFEKEFSVTFNEIKNILDICEDKHVRRINEAQSQYTQGTDVLRHGNDNHHNVYSNYHTYYIFVYSKNYRP